MDMQTIIIIAFSLAFLSSLLLTGLIRKFALRLGLLDHPSGRKAHDRPVPHSGGIAIVLSTLGVLSLIAIAVLARNVISAILPLPSHVISEMELAVKVMPFLLYICGGGAVIALLGFLDDVHDFPASIKLIGQIAVITLIVLSSGMQITLFLPFGWVQVFITILWILLLTNSFNLLDNMDGLSGTVAIICGFALVICAAATQQFFITGLFLCLTGAILGFLFYNFPPASIFMGDSGSMFIGYMLASGSVITTFLEGPEQHRFKPLIVPLIIFALPLYDTFSVIFIRILHNESIFKGDTNHFSHRLQRGGMSKKHVLLTIMSVTIATSLGATIPYGQHASWLLIVPAIQVVCIMAVLMQMEIWKL